jgi:hypothetical protein
MSRDAPAKAAVALAVWLASDSARISALAVR